MTTVTQAARIKPIEPPYEPDVDRYLNKLMPPDSGLEPLRIFRTLAVNFDLATRMRPLSAGLLAHGTIAPRERELVILRTTALNGAAYEWGVHATIFKELTREEIRDSALESAPWSGSDALVIRLCDELHAGSMVSDELWEGLSAHWSDEQLLELLILAGWYRAISYVINALRIEPEQWAARMP
ncbi:MAG TPA: carboxymuconolactone decarboxylase family protein [Thermoleophilaceae bacterium]|jgi:alkylhydroperoxidase family enzyme